MSKYLDPKLHDVWDYNPETGKFIWKVNTHGNGGSIRIGDEAGTSSHGYIQLRYKGEAYSAHILIWVWQTGELPPKGYEIDHRNRIRGDNRWDNLRVLNKTGNNLNHNGPQKNNTSGARGVYPKRDNKWFARINIDRKVIHLGVFDNFEQALEARKQAEIKFWNKE